MYRVVALIHAWVGLLASGFLAVISLSGSILVYRDQLIALTLPKHQFTEALETSEALAKIFGGLDLKSTQFIVLPSRDLPFYKVTHDNSLSYFDLSGVRLETTNEFQRFDEWLFVLHHYLLMGKTGEPFVGAIGVFCILMILLGFYLWLRTWRQFKINIFPISLKRRDLISHHRNLGIVFLVPIAFVSVTGAAMIFDDLAKSVISNFTGIKTMSMSKIEIAEADVTIDNLSTGIKLAHERMPNAEMRFISLPREKKDPINFRIKQTNELHPNGRTIISYDYGHKKIARIIDAQKLDATSRIYNTVYPLHSGRFDNAIYMFLLFLSGLALSTISVLSAFSYIRHLAKKQNPLKEPF